jgi:hypothetical protein
MTSPTSSKRALPNRSASIEPESSNAQSNTMRASARPATVIASDERSGSHALIVERLTKRFGERVAIESVALVLGLGAALLVVDTVGWRFVAALFDRERLVTGGRT